jgi:ATP-binding cassette subfamily B protein
VYIFKDLSFTIYPGEDIAIVGENGAGKSTLVKLLCRFYDVTSGKILIDGRDLKSIDLKSWYSQLGTLFQDFNKYAYTVEENLDLSMNEDAGHRLTRKARSDAFMTALSKASADFVREYPRGLQTVLARSHKHGIDPSGGQWQRIALARAFYRDANILILDEPTSAIDAKGEYDIFEQIRAHQKNKTTIIISHRFSTVRNAQRILVIESGKLIESGTHDELMQHESGLYKLMFTKQAEGYQ